MRKSTYKCLECGYENKVGGMGYNEIAFCPICSGISVDKWNVCKVVSEKDNVNKPLLTIELESETAVPKVFYKGEEITMKRHVSFEWDTSDERSRGGMSYEIEHFEKRKGHISLNRMGREIDDHV